MKLVLILILSFLSSAAMADQSYVVYDLKKEAMVHQQNSAEVRPMASLTKLMTALIVVESLPNWDEKIKYKGNVFFSRMVSKKELLESLLIRSDNNAAEAFANAWAGGRNEFIERMNVRARIIGMRDTHYTDPSGLDQGNITTASDLLSLIKIVSHYDLIKKTSSSKYLTIEKRIGKKIKSVSLGNTNQNLLFEFDNIVLSKTGFTNPAGRCLALIVEKEKHEYGIIILGEKTIKTRSDKARNLINNYVTIQDIEE